MHVCRYLLDLMQGVTTLYVVQSWGMPDDEGDSLTHMLTTRDMSMRTAGN
jgi:hypothetical protein